MTPVDRGLERNRLVATAT